MVSPLVRVNRSTTCIASLCATPFIVAVVAYLLGSIPFGYLLVRVFRGEDIRLTGSGNIGATNVARSGAKGLGIATLALDALKGAAAVMFAWFMALQNAYVAIRVTAT